jgi:hypothetical protein
MAVNMGRAVSIRLSFGRFFDVHLVIVAGARL